MIDQSLFIRDHVVAVSQMLLGNRKLKHGVIITGGEVLDFEGKVALAKTVSTAGADLIHLGFANDEHGRYGLHSLMVMVPRDDGVHIKSDCRLWLSQAGKRALLVPPPGHRGSFRLSVDEISHLPDRPANEEAGAARAMKQLLELVKVAPDHLGCLSIRDTIPARHA